MSFGAGGHTFFLVDDPSFDAHVPAAYHPERPARLGAARRALGRVEARGHRPIRLPARAASSAELEAAHDAVHVERLLALSGRSARIDADTFVSPGSVEAARRAAGGAVDLVRALASPSPNGPRKGLLLARPPGHHATPSRAMGFCLVNHAAVAAREALALGLPRVAIVDFDVHHGNGTQDAFYADPRVLYASLHEWPLYPGTGAADELGEGEGLGATLNVPLSGGADGRAYARAFERLVLPVLDAFAPDLLLVSAGFDAHARDPLSSMRLAEADFARMTEGLRLAAERHAGGRMALFLEGGYDLAALEGSLAASLLAMLGDADPNGEAAAEAGRGEPDPRHVEDLSRALASARLAWKNL